MEIEFFFDPSCPFCWITSRWLIQVKDARQLNITWRPFSLAIKNDCLDASKPTRDEHAGYHRQSHRVLRVMQAAASDGADLGELYTAFGTQCHVYGEDYTDEIIAKVLADLKLPAELLSAADDKSYDKALQASLDSALEVVGDDVGVPTIVFNDDGKRTGYFGPVLQKLPSVTDSLKLWDGLQVLATNQDFYELKRTRPSGGPETASTAVCVP